MQKMHILLSKMSPKSQQKRWPDVDHVDFAVRFRGYKIFSSRGLNWLCVGQCLLPRLVVDKSKQTAKAQFTFALEATALCLETQISMKFIQK